MRISHEAIYQALYVQGRGALERELVACLRTGRALRVPRSRSQKKAWGHVTPDVLISERPAEADDRAVSGHWEGDLVIGLERSAIGTLVERTTRFTVLVHLPRRRRVSPQEHPEERPGTRRLWGGHNEGRARSQDDHPPSRAPPIPHLGQRQGTLSARSIQSRDGHPVFFADPRSPWQRGTNENTNGLLRQYFPKGTDLSRWNAEDIDAVAAMLNSRPRKTLGWKTPAEAFNEHLLLTQRAGVASID